MSSTSSTDSYAEFEPSDVESVDLHTESSDTSQDYPNTQEHIEALYSSVENVQQELILLYSPKDISQESKSNQEERRLELMKSIENIMLEMIVLVKRGETPKLMLRNMRSWENCIFDERLCLKPVEEAMMSDVKFGDKRSRPKYALIIFILGKIYKLISTRNTCTKRELYYQNVDKIVSQDQLDSVLNNVMCLMETPLHELNVFATSKGLIYGPVEIIKTSGSINCQNFGGTLIPHDICNITEIKSDAKFILVVEKDAIFQKLLDDGDSSKLGSCIFITGKGFPDINTRYLLQLMWNMLAIPIFVLVDPDPWGIEIMCVYRFGSLSMSHQADQLAVPSMRWLGIHPSEIDKFYDINEPLNDRDKAKLQDILKRPYIRDEPLLMKEIQILLDKNYKAEIEGIESTPVYLSNVYLRLKITNADFL